MISIFLAGMISAFSPCVLPLIPIVAMSAIEKSYKNFLILIIGFISSFSIVGIVVGIISAKVFFDPNVVRMWGAYLMIFMGLVMLSTKLQSYVQNLTFIFKFFPKNSPKFFSDSAFYQGLSLGLIWAPCIGPALGAALGWLASEDTQFKGGLHVAVFGLGAGCSLALLGFLNHRLGFQWFHKQKKRLRKLYLTAAMAMIVIGIFVLLAWDKRIEAYFTERLPEWWQNLLVEI